MQKKKMIKFVDMHSMSFRALAILLAVFLTLSMIPAVPASADDEDVVKVSTGAQLDSAISNASVGTTIELQNDIDAVSSATYDGSTITIDGNGYTIDGKSNDNTAIRFDETSSIEIKNVTIQNCVGNIAFGGGGLSIYYGEINAENCSFIGNSTLVGDGGGVLIDAEGNGSSFVNCTFYGNEATYGSGGAISAAGEVKIINCTIVGNTAKNYGGGIYNNARDYATTVYNSIIIGNSSTTGSDAYKFTDGGSNLIGTGSITTQSSSSKYGISVTDANWLDSAPAGNGYSIPTIALLDVEDSPAVDTANVTYAPATDQRGVTRGLAPDIGAFELEQEEGGGGTITPSNSVINYYWDSQGNTLVKYSTSVVTEIEGPEVSGYTLTEYLKQVYNIYARSYDSYIEGYEDGLFRPDNSLSRAEACQMIYDLFDITSTGSVQVASDVEAGKWYYDVVSALYDAEIVDGYTDGTFRPDETITRAEFTAIIVRVANATGTSDISFSDIEDHWAYNEIMAAAANGLVDGYTDGTFLPDTEIERAEAVTVLNRQDGRDSSDAEGLTMQFADVTEHWAYNEIIVASVNYTEKITNSNIDTSVASFVDVNGTEIQVSSDSSATFTDPGVSIDGYTWYGAYETVKYVYQVNNEGTNIYEVSTWAEFINATETVPEGSTIKLINNITDAGEKYLVTGDDDIDTISSATVGFVGTDVKLTIDGDGYTIEAGENKTFSFMVSADVTFKNITIDGAAYGPYTAGAFYTRNCTLTLDTVTMQNCVAYHNVTGNGGGAVYVNRNCNLIATNCNFIGNKVALNEGTTIGGGELIGSGGAIYAVNGTTTTIDNCYFKGNEAAYGGAIAASGSANITVTNCEFSGNDSTYGGDDIYIYDGHTPSRMGASDSAVTYNISGNTYSADGDTWQDYSVVRASVLCSISDSEGNTTTYAGSGEDGFVEGGWWLQFTYVDADAEAEAPCRTQDPSSSQYGEIYKVSTWTEFEEAATSAVSGSTITLTNDISGAGDSYIETDENGVDAISSATIGNVNISRDITIEGNGYSITAGQNKTFCFMFQGCEVTINNITIDGAAYGRKMGGAIYTRGATTINMNNVTMQNCAAYNASSTNGGGAIYLNSNGVLNATDCNFINNKIAGSTTTIADSDVTGIGGAIYLSSSTAVITNCYFENNESAYGGAIAALGSANLTVTNSTFSGNDSIYGGDDIYIFDGYTPSRRGASDSAVTCNLSGNTYSSDGDTWKDYSVVRASVLCSIESTDSEGNITITTYVGSGEDGFTEGGWWLKFTYVDADTEAEAPCRTQDPTSSEYIPYTVSTWDEFKEAATSAVSGSTITLTNDISGAGDSYIETDENGVDTISSATIGNVNISRDITIEGNGYSITAGQNKTFCFMFQGCEVTINNLTIDGAAYGRKMGGAIYTRGATTINMNSVTMQNCAAYNTSSTNGGGAIYLNSNGELNATDCNFINNKIASSTNAIADGDVTGIGGAIYLSSSTAVITNCYFRNNESAYGGAIAAFGSANLTVTNSTFSENDSIYGGDDIYIFDGYTPSRRGASDSAVTYNISGNTYSADGDTWQDYSVVRASVLCSISDSEGNTTTYAGSGEDGFAEGGWWLKFTYVDADTEAEAPCRTQDPSFLQRYNEL